MKKFSVTMTAQGRRKRDQFEATVDVDGGVVETAVARAIRMLVGQFMQEVKRRRPSKFQVTVTELGAEESAEGEG